MLEGVNERFSTRTTVRQPRVLLMWAAIAGLAAFVVLSFVARMNHAGPVAVFGNLWWWVAGPIFAAIRARPKIDTFEVTADRAGIRFGAKTIPRERLNTALLRREADKTFVLLRGKGPAATVDVRVKDDAEADALCDALGLDAKHATAEFSLHRGAVAMRRSAVFVMVAALAAAFFLIKASAMLVPVALGLVAAIGVLGVPLLVMQHRAKLVVGADGIVVKEGLSKQRFIAHDEIESATSRAQVLRLTLKNGTVLDYNVGVSERNEERRRAESEMQAQSIVWRIRKAREAYDALAGNAPDAAAALDRGGRSAREWLDQLRRIGEGATATFRNAGLTRDQLLAIVESTTARAKERLAALVALHDGLTEDEKPRVRVAADRCVLPELRERMVRVADATNDEELVDALEETHEIGR